MLRLNHESYVILIDHDPTFSFGSVDNPNRYDHSHRLDDESYIPSSSHSVRVISTDDDQEVASCVLQAAGGATGIHEHSAAVHGKSLLLAVGPFMVSLDLPALDLNWKTQTDQATCFGVFHSTRHRCYISHGELQIARVSYAGTVEWTNGGADIFTNGFSIYYDTVEAVDWNEDVYVWDIQTGLLDEKRSTAKRRFS